MLLTSLAAFEFPCYVIVRFINASREDYLPPDTVFAIRRNGDLMHLTVDQHALFSRQQVEDLLLELTDTKNGPTDMR